jgi:high-affinity iron transporter
MVLTTNHMKAMGARTLQALMALSLVLFMMVPVRAYAADDTIYEKWSDYSAANGTEGVTWNVVANEMDKLIDGAFAAYEQGDSDTAYHYINDCGYYGWYETTGFERTVMGSIGGSRVSEVELAFSTTRSAAKKGGELDEFKYECEHL